MERRELLKPSRFGNIEKRRILDTKNLKEKRSLRRTTIFNNRRNIDDVAQETKENIAKNVPPKKDPVLDRKLALKKFRAEKEIKKRALNYQRKPPFIVGIPHHGASPILKNLSAENNCKKETKTTATQEFSFQPKIHQSAKKLTSPHTPTVLKRSVQKKPLNRLTNVVIKGRTNVKNSHVHDDGDEVLAAPLFRTEEVDETQAQESFDGTQAPNERIESAGNLCVSTSETSNILNLIKSEDEGINIQDGDDDPEPASQDSAKHVNSKTKLRRNPKRSHLHEPVEELPVQLIKMEDNVNENHEEKSDGGTQEIIETERDTSMSTFETSNILNFIKSEDEGINIQNGDENPEPASQDRAKQVNPKTKLRRNPKRSHLHEPVEELPVQLIKVKDNVNENHEEKSAGGTQKRNGEDEGAKRKDENHELAEEVAFQHSRVQTETNRLEELADQWHTVVLREGLPQDVVDEVDSVVGQTRLLTSDKFQQFRRLIVQFENKTGTHPVTLDDLNGFWDMVYLQVESLDKKYTSLEVLKNNGWVYPEPATKKKRRPAKKLTVNKVPETDKSTSEKTRKQSLLQPPEDQQILTPTTDRKSVISSVLNRKRTRSNSPSPYIAMRLSGVGRTPSIVVHSPRTDATPRSTLDNTTEAYGTPKSALKKSMTRLSESTIKRTSILPTMSLFETKIEEAVEEINHLNDDELLMPPAITPRRSIRLMSKQSTPAPCSVCDSPSCDKSMCVIPRMPKSSSKRSRKSQKSPMSPVEKLQETKTESESIKDSASKSTKKILTFSPSESQLTGDCVTVPDVNKPSTSGVRFSLRPSILTVRENNNFCEMPKKSKKRRQASVFSPNATTAEMVAEEPMRAKSQHSTRQSKRVTFVSEAEEKSSFKLPATPYRKFQADV